MGDEIAQEHFSKADYERFHAALLDETEQLVTWLAAQAPAQSLAGPAAHPPAQAGWSLGFEVEAWLMDAQAQPLPRNLDFLKGFDHPMATVELAQFNVEFNTPVFTTGPDCFCTITQTLCATLRRAEAVAQELGGHLLLAGSLPTLTAEHLGPHRMTGFPRFRALNHAILEQRGQRPLRIEIDGPEQRWVHEQADVMLEAAATSLQIHLATTPSTAHRLYNAALAASGVVVAVSGNTPYVLGHSLWEETRIPLFEQAVAAGGYGGGDRGPIRRVTFGSGYLRAGIGELFQENARHFPVLLPSMQSQDDPGLPHLGLHNGTIWRWNRPIVSFDQARGELQLRLEHRSLPAGPSVPDMLANTAFFIGLVEYLQTLPGEGAGGLPFGRARDNFYAAARYGLQSRLYWAGEADPKPVAWQVLNRLLPKAAEGLYRLGIDGTECDRLLGIIAARVQSGQTGAQWQRQWLAQHGEDFARMTQVYHAWQCTGQPVHEWDL